MEVIDYINTIIVNSFGDWVRCHNDMLHNIHSSETGFIDELNDKEIRIIGHVLKVLYNDKISVSNKYYLLISIEENLEYFVKTENGALHLAQTLVTDFKNSLNSKWDHRYMCQLLVVICSSSLYYDLFLSSNCQCCSFVQELISTLFDIISNDNVTTNWINLKHVALSSIMHLESTYPTLFSEYEDRLAEMVKKEKLIQFELLLQIYSLVFSNKVLNKCRLHQSINPPSATSSQNEIFNKNEVRNLLMWIKNRNLNEKIVGSQTNDLMLLKFILDQAMANLSPLAINFVVRNCFIVTTCLSQQNTALWSTFIARFISSNNLNILEALVTLKISSKSAMMKDDIFPGEQLQETLLAFLNNCRLFLPKRQIMAQWLLSYPVEEHKVIGKEIENYTCLLEPELIRHLYLRSLDVLEIKYCKLILLSRVLKTFNETDSNSILLFSSLKDIIKSLHYFDSDVSSNILLRVMFAMHIQHPSSVLVRDFESVLENIVVQYPNILSAVMFYLSGLERFLINDEQSHILTIKCLTQMAKMSSEKLRLSMNKIEFSSVKLHIQVLNYATKFSEIDITENLAILHNLITSFKLDVAVNWIEDAYDLLLNLCFNIIKNFGSSKFYQELTNILNEIRNELSGRGTEIKANFLYALMASLPCKKVKELLNEKRFEDINDKDFLIIKSCLIETHLDDQVLVMKRGTNATSSEQSLYKYGNSLDGYLYFLDNHTFTLVFNMELSSNNDFRIDRFLYGVSVDFVTDSYHIDIAPWHLPFIRDFNIKNTLHIIIKEPEVFTISTTLAATKMDGTFVIYGVKPGRVDLMDLGIIMPVDFSIEHSKHIFLNDLCVTKLTTSSFVSINFKNDFKFKVFKDVFEKFVFIKEGDDIIYLIFLPPKFHIMLKTSVISIFRRRFDINTDLKIINLLSIERYLKHFEL